jgi:hypothetical protein
MPGLGRKKPRPSLTAIDLAPAVEICEFSPADAETPDGNDVGEITMRHAVTRRDSRRNLDFESLSKFVSPRKISPGEVAEDWSQVRRASHPSVEDFEDSGITVCEKLEAIYKDLSSRWTVIDAGVDLEESPADHFGKITTILLESRSTLENT